MATHSTNPKSTSPKADTPKATGTKATSPKATSPKPTTVLYVRHGRTASTGTVLPGRAPGLHLSDEGRNQAERAAERLGTLSRIAAVYASPLERTRETAAPIAKALGLKVGIQRGLIECDFGDWTGEALATLRKKREWSLIQNTPSEFTFPGGESFVEMSHRITSTVRTLVGRHEGETIVVVSHADPIKAAVAAAQGTPLDLFQRIVISPCSITPIIYGGGAPIVLAVNSTGDDLSTLAPS